MAQSPPETQLAGAGGAEATLGSEPPDLGVDTASDTWKLCGLGGDKLSGLHIPTAPSILSGSVFSILEMSYRSSCLLPRKSPKDTLSVAAPSSLQCP